MESWISNLCLWCLANHNALCQLANKSRLRLSEGGTLKKIGTFDCKRRCIEWSVYDIRVPREPLESIVTTCSLIALVVL